MEDENHDADQSTQQPPFLISSTPRSQNAQATDTPTSPNAVQGRKVGTNPLSKALSPSKRVNSNDDPDFMIEDGK